MKKDTKDSIKKLIKRRRNYYIYALIVFALSVAISSITSSNYSFPNSSYSNLGNPSNPLQMVFNLGLITSAILLSIYVRYISIKLFENSELYRISFIIPTITLMFIGFFPSNPYHDTHGLAIGLNFIILGVLAPVNFFGLYKLSKKVFWLTVSLVFIFGLLILLTLYLIPFDSSELGVLETVCLAFILCICIVMNKHLSYIESSLNK